MSNKKFDIFFAFVKLKSYLTSLIDEPETASSNLELTEEYFGRKYPHKKEELIEILKLNGINCDADIAFESLINTKFKEIARAYHSKIDIQTILSDLEIESTELSEKLKVIDDIVSERDKSTKTIIRNLLSLAKQWAIHKEIEVDIDDFSTLDEEEVIRIEEKAELNELDVKSHSSFKDIVLLSNKYLEELTDHFFLYGGNVYLKELLNLLEKIKSNVDQKYEQLYKNSGL
ncbi:MAG: hypothetical protein K9J12_10765 [Melioribacteraceae bacterium]|nr:hypothetical protein [Melioribacteraceae bacterium]MCF8265891.1 hypothetical protein [Melioribacteraceae bacterium]MCF8412884.1 hypothetical protein [Melioribacteraceae bacterium]MCF8432708.1 hypothetical protein [Melioribacteraceae bacterium]